jgi:cell pole-organizing protein PopZ
MKLMSFPVLPPIFEREFPRPLTAPLTAGPAVEVTRDSPSEAFDLYSEAVCEALEAVSFAASVALAVVDSNLRADRPESLVDCRRTLREMANDMLRSTRL